MVVVYFIYADIIKYWHRMCVTQVFALCLDATSVVFHINIDACIINPSLGAASPTLSQLHVHNYPCRMAHVEAITLLIVLVKRATEDISHTEYTWLSNPSPRAYCLTEPLCYDDSVVFLETALYSTRVIA